MPMSATGGRAGAAHGTAGDPQLVGSDAFRDALGELLALDGEPASRAHDACAQRPALQNMSGAVLATSSPGTHGKFASLTTAWKMAAHLNE